MKKTYLAPGIKTLCMEETAIMAGSNLFLELDSNNQPTEPAQAPRFRVDNDSDIQFDF
ncbi:MAG: hypothetical protein IJ604_13485 [Prevotella sp.]|nr:hypothetical protein [Prevotella sp.]